MHNFWCAGILPDARPNLTLFIAVSKGYLYQRQDGLIALLRTLEGQQIIICASCAVRKFAADGRPPLVDRAATRRRIEKLTSFPKDGVGLSLQNVFALPGCRETALCSFNIDPKIVGEPVYITLGYLNSLIDRAAVGRTLRAVVVAWLGCFRDRPRDSFRHA